MFGSRLLIAVVPRLGCTPVLDVKRTTLLIKNGAYHLYDSHSLPMSFVV